jgi:hypothetical protein
MSNKLLLGSVVAAVGIFASFAVTHAQFGVTPSAAPNSPVRSGSDARS